MAKIFVITETNSFGEEEIVGACSSKEKADLAIEAKKYFGSFDNFGVHVDEFEIDGIIKDTISDLEQELEHYDKSKALLDKLKEP